MAEITQTKLFKVFVLAGQLLLLSIVLLCTQLTAKGINAGTKIINSATLSYHTLEQAYSMTSNTVIDTVAQVLDVDVLSLDINEQNVLQGAKAQLLTFQITNTGNGEDHFLLSIRSDSSSTFSVENQKIFLDENNNSQLDTSDPLIDTLALMADESRTVFITADIPSPNLNDDDIAKVILSAKSQLGGSGTAGTVFPSKSNDIVMIDGLKGGMDNAYGLFTVANFNIVLQKNAAVSNTFGTTEPITGATIHYEINVSAIGEGTAEDIVISDPLPQEVRYIANSMMVDNITLSDINDSDHGYYDKENRTVYIMIDTLNSGENKHITFNTIIK